VEKLKHEIQQELETHKTRLRKSEFLFQKEFEAASALAFMALRRSLILKYRFPEMDWHDACEDFAGDFDKVEGVP
jgi:glutathione S-transferase